MPLDTVLLSDYISLSKKALLLIDHEFEVRYCSPDATMLLNRMFEENIKQGHNFRLHSTFVNKELSRILQQHFSQSVQNTTPKRIERLTQGHFTVDLHLYRVEKQNSGELLVFLELTEPDLKSSIPSNDIKQIGAVLSKLGDYVWIHNFLMNETFFSGDFNFFTGYTINELKANEVPDVWWRCTHPADRQLLLDSDLKYKKGLQASHNLEYRIIDRNGKLRWVLDKGVVVQWQPNKLPALIIGTHTDISELKRLQEEMDELKRQRDNEMIFASFSSAEEDRKLITDFLNENISQLLSAAYVKLNAGETTSFNSGNSEVKQILQQTIEAIKDVCNQIDPSPLEIFELDEVLSDVVNFFQTRSGKYIELLFNDSRSDIQRHYHEELTIVRVLQDFLQYCAGNKDVNDVTVVVKYDYDELVVKLMFTNAFFNKVQYLNRKNVIMLIGRCQYFSGNFDVRATNENRVHLLVNLKIKS